MTNELGQSCSMNKREEKCIQHSDAKSGGWLTLKCKPGCDDDINTDRRKVVCDAVGFNHLADSCEHGQEHSESRKTN
jgi:hypothetical protein